MQNHSSYNDWADYDNFSPDITVDGSDSEVLSAYLSLMKLSDQATERLVDYFAKEEEDTVIVFFGDHQPTDSVVNPVLKLNGTSSSSLSADSVVNPVLKLNGTSSSSLSAEEEALRYQVPFFIWANYDIEEESGLNISANYLASRTLDAAGLPKPGYFSFLSELEKQAPVISANSANYLASRTLDAAGLPKPGYFSFLSELEKQAPVISANHVSLSDGTFSSADDQDELLREYKTFQYHQLFD